MGECNGFLFICCLQGLTEAVHGETSTFYIQANDETGEPLDGSLDEEMPFQVGNFSMKVVW